MRQLTKRLLEGLTTTPRYRDAVSGADLEVSGGTVGTAESWAEPLPDGALRRELREELARRWRLDSERFRQSAWTFAALSAELAELRAPKGLRNACHEASLAELAHAEIALGLAGRYRGAPRSAARRPRRPRRKESQLEELAVRTVNEGCVQKTLDAVLAGERLRRASDPLARLALNKLVAGHGRHAELAYRIVLWAIEIGGEQVRTAVERAFEVALERATEAPETLRASLDSSELNAHGRLGPFQLAHVIRVALLEVVEPCRAALLRVEEEVEWVARVARHQREESVHRVSMVRGRISALPPGVDVSLAAPDALELRGTLRSSQDLRSLSLKI